MTRDGDSCCVEMEVVGSLGKFLYIMPANSSGIGVDNETSTISERC